MLPFIPRNLLADFNGAIYVPPPPILRREIAGDYYYEYNFITQQPEYLQKIPYFHFPSIQFLQEEKEEEDDDEYSEYFYHPYDLYLEELYSTVEDEEEDLERNASTFGNYDYDIDEKLEEMYSSVEEEDNLEKDSITFPFIV